MTPEERADLALTKIAQAGGDPAAVRTALLTLFREAQEETLKQVGLLLRQRLHPQLSKFDLAADTALRDLMAGIFDPEELVAIILTADEAFERAAQIAEHPQPFDFHDARGRRFFGEVPGSQPHAEAIRALKGGG